MGVPGSNNNTAEVKLDNTNYRIRGLQIDVCDVDNYLSCTACETTERTSGFDCMVNEIGDGCSRVVLVSKPDDGSGNLIEKGTGAIFTLRYDVSGEASAGECRDLNAENVWVSDEFEDMLNVEVYSGKFCFLMCGDIYPDESSPGANDCGNGVVDIVDVLEAIDIVLGFGLHSGCQLTRADLPNGLPPSCREPDGIIDVFDILVIIDLALDRPDCCRYYYTGEIKCTTDEDCNDGLYCNGDESCVDGVCQPGTEPCSDDGLYCNGEEGCDEENDLCTHSGNPCAEPYMCDEESDICDDDYPRLNEPDFPTCPDGYYLIGNYEDLLLATKAPTSHTYSFNLDCNADLIVDGFAREGHPEDMNCTLLGGSEPQCNQHQEYESFEVDVDGTTFGNYTDYLGTPDVENAWFNAGPWTTTASDVDHDLTFTHSEDGTTGPNSVSYKVSFCAKCIDCDDANCDDGLYCNGSESCVDGVCQPGTEPCSDDGLYCNGTESCNEDAGQCESSGDPCVPNNCDDVNDICVECLDDADCNDGLYCNGDESCVDGVCEPGINPCADDGEFCNGVEFCDEDSDGCDTVDACPDDGLYCNGDEYCDVILDECKQTGDPCDDGNDCTDDACDETGDVCTNYCNASSPTEPCCSDAACSSLDFCQAGGVINIGNFWANCGDVGVKIDICLENLNVPVGGFQMDLCENSIRECAGTDTLCFTDDDCFGGNEGRPCMTTGAEPDCLTCVECEMTERTVLFDCVVNELADGCCRVILFSKNPGGLINPGECDIVTIVYEISDNPECCDECIPIDGRNIIATDKYGFDILGVIGETGEVCPLACGDIEPADDPATPEWDCGDDKVDIFDILEGTALALGQKPPDACQAMRADVPTGTPPYCLGPDGAIDILDLMVIIDSALDRPDCCSYYYGGVIY